MPSLISNSNNSNPYDKQFLNSREELQQIPSDNVAINNFSEEAREDAGSWSNFSVCMQGGIYPLSTAQETDVFQDAERLSEQRHPNNNQDGDLQDLVSALLRKNKST